MCTRVYGVRECMCNGSAKLIREQARSRTERVQVRGAFRYGAGSGTGRVRVRSAFGSGAGSGTGRVRERVTGEHMQGAAKNGAGTI